MTIEIDPVARAQADVAAARAALDETLAQLQVRLAPKRLARDTAREAAAAGGVLVDRAGDTARRHPGVIGGIAAAIGLVAARKPLIRLVRRRDEPAPRSKRSRHGQGQA